MNRREQLLRQGLRHDPQKRRQSQRSGREKGVRITISAAELRAANIDPNGPAPQYRVFATGGTGAIQVRLYR